MPMDVHASVALVTGGASGIGAGICRMLAAAGVHVVIADIDQQGAAALAQDIGGLAVTCDVTSLVSMRGAVDRAVTEYGGLDLLVLNAGVASGFTLDLFDEEAYRRAMGVNLDGVVFGLVAGVPALRADRGGQVLVVASLAGLAPVPLDPVYAANKAAVVNLVRSVAPGLAAQGVHVSALCPGFTETPILAPVREVLTSTDWPVMSVADIVDAVTVVLESPTVGEAWLVQHGRPVVPFRFPTVPGPVRASGSPSTG